MKDDVMTFANDDTQDSTDKFYFKIIIADDEPQIHEMTKMILRDFHFEGRKLKFIDAYSGLETKHVLKEHPDAALIFLDVVMETEHAGLDVVKYLRDDLENSLMRIVLRTGQPGEAPEERVIRDYDINDYRLKTELTYKRLNTTLYAALRNYEGLVELHKHKEGLEKIIQASARLFEHNSLNDFLSTMLKELSKFQTDYRDVMYIREDEKQLENGLVILEQTGHFKIIAGAGSFETYQNSQLNDVPGLVNLKRWIKSNSGENAKVYSIDQGFVIVSRGKSDLNNYIYIESRAVGLDFQLINLFLSNFSIALDNYILNNMLLSSQREIVFTLAETVDSHFEETGRHTSRIADMMYQFALVLRYSFAESEMIKFASTMHDLGKVGIPDEILKKPGKLSDREYETMKEHSIFGYNILKKPELPIIKMAAEVALHHHEKWDGSGYPLGKEGLDIPKFARMMALVDVFDAMTHDRIYKKRISVEEALRHIEEEKGKHFDPELTDIFIENIDFITQGIF